MTGLMSVGIFILYIVGAMVEHSSPGKVPR
jgi:hypothetical protein